MKNPKTRRQLLTYEDSTPAVSQHKKPCSDCPWARHAVPGWLGSFSAEEWAQLAHSEGKAECHVHTGVDCAGLAIYRANVCKLPRDPEALVLPSDHEAVFARRDEFMAHHGQAIKRVKRKVS